MNFIKKNSLIATIVLSTALVVFFYSFVFKNPEKVFFSDRGSEGPKEYFSSIYHIKYDSSYFFCTSMNYPYGEELKFFGIQSLPINTIKFIHANTGMFNEFTVVAYINISIILSLLISAIFIHLILKKLGLAWWMQVCFATSIAFLTPQLGRFGGHYPLAINCFIPMAMYFLMLFHEKKKIWISLLIGLFYLYVYEVHGYFFFMTATLPLVYFIYIFIKDRSQTVSNGMHFFLQIIAPFAVIVLLDIVSSGVTDRTAYPWGHMEYLAYPESVFLPMSRGYFSTLGQMLFNSTDYMTFEGRVFIGYLGLAVIIVILGRLILKDTRPFVTPTKNLAFNAVLVASLLLLLFSFGFPFILDLQSLVQYSGPIKQLRALGRFSWPFYYAINIFAVYYIYNYFNPKVTYAFAGCACIILFLEVNYLNSYKRIELNNQWGNLTSMDTNNSIYKLSKEIDTNAYAAILPIPFFSVGSENINIDVRGGDISESYALSLRTGLPLISSMSSRLSFQQAYEMQKIFFEPYRKNIIWDQVKAKNNKDILVFVYDSEKLSEGEMAIINHSKKIIQHGNAILYSFNPSDADKIVESLYNEKTKNIDTTQRQDIHAEELVNGFYYKDFKGSGQIGYLNKGVLETAISKRTLVDSIEVPKNISGNYILSFWFSDIYYDVLPRTDLLVNRVSDSNEENEIIKHELSKQVKIIDGHWALYEDTMYIPEGTKKIVLYGINKEISKGVLTIDDILIRRAGQNILFNDPKGIIINNRRYLK